MEGELRILPTESENQTDRDELDKVMSKKFNFNPNRMETVRSYLRFLEEKNLVKNMNPFLLVFATFIVNNLKLENEKLVPETYQRQLGILQTEELSSIYSQIIPETNVDYLVELFTYTYLIASLNDLLPSEI